MVFLASGTPRRDTDAVTARRPIGTARQNGSEALGDGRSGLPCSAIPYRG